MLHNAGGAGVRRRARTATHVSVSLLFAGLSCAFCLVFWFELCAFSFWVLRPRGCTRDLVGAYAAVIDVVLYGE